MPIFPVSEVEQLTLPGLSHRTVAGPRDGLSKMEVWKQTIEAGAETPRHRHDCEEVILILEGEGTCEVDGETRSFGADSVLIVPPNRPHKIVNTGAGPMHLVAALSAAPVTVETPGGEHIPLPWDQHEYA